MAKRSTSQRKGSSGSAGELKRSLDKTERELLRLLSEHARLSERLARRRHEEGGLLYDAEAEQQRLQQFVQANRGPLGERCVRAVYRELISGSRSLLKPLRVAYLGPTYSYSHLAAVERFGSSAELVPVATISAVFEELNRAHVNFGIV
ncbi:MAG: chorismate mutase, partial [Planctomycetes bacterium]|nr:chorismate mutase [Planctomycetota bacterium]